MLSAVLQWKLIFRNTSRENNLLDKAKFYNAVLAKVDEANKKYGTNIIVHNFRWRKKGNAAGYAGYYGQSPSNSLTTFSISLSEEVAEKYPDVMLNEVIPHEVAHLVGFATGRDQGHGAWWRIYCVGLGGNGKRTHSCQVTPARRTRTFEYKTASGKAYMIGARVHNQIQTKLAVRRICSTGEMIYASCFTGIVA
jgi:predicted SprT family Zn-dependent metalloprotease